ncbi:TetR/AcrR family transcriptional regulator [Arthrobacter wenxiniae]|uniref:TetR/AcrR family transcriptional regulator n=1 Tax=Arthrobacter wenxiniae TaxID=2713570 RepID=A0A7Y7LYX0_9MICC|nr:TetR/AcrR family transcriptional regulator [Arthrobacter wenxiniae]NVM95920.1 TetR/AcrR family transcriptional regulator [Arthrobacter wenxiniae]
MNFDGQLPPKARLLKAAAELLANSAGKPVSTRQITELAGVTAPTLYHHFGDKEGLFNAVIDVGFEEYVAGEHNFAPTGKPLADVRQIWDNHLKFGLDNPQLYSVMFGNIRPESRPARVAEAEGFMEEMLEKAAAAGQLCVAPQEAARSILAANVGVTLMLIAEPAAERNFDLSDMTREAVISAVSSEAELSGAGAPVGASSVVVAAIALNAALESSHPEQLSTTELKMFLEWLDRIAKTS